MSIIQDIAFVVLLVAVLAIILVPWISICDIANNCKDIAWEIRKLREEIEKRCNTE